MSYIQAGGGGGSGSGVFGPVVSVPANETAPGTPYEIAFDSVGNFYVCYNTNTWAKYLNVAPFGSSAGDSRITQAGDTRVTLAGDTRVMQ